MPASVTAVTAAIRARHGEVVRACLFYGSCLRDGQYDDAVLDFFVLVDSYRRFHRGRLAAMANALVPPSYYYLEVPFREGRLRAKYAVIALSAFERGCSADAFVPTLWARMAQPCALTFTRDDEVRGRVTRALAAAVEATAAAALPLVRARFTPEQLWTRAFRESYRTEFRAERRNRPEQLHDAFADRYAALTAAALRGRARPDGNGGAGPRFAHRAASARRLRSRASWLGRRVAGRALHALRLIKNAYTFDDGLDYVLWKIERHSGVRAEPRPWQRRHPLLAVPSLAWRLYRRGAFR